MIYPQKSRRPKRKIFMVTLAVAVLVVAGALSVPIFAGGLVSKIAMTVSRPFSSSFLALKNNLSFTANLIRSRGALVRENRELRADIEADQVKLLRLDAIFREHQDLLSAYGRSLFTKQATLGNIIAKPPQSPYDVLVVDIGSEQGIVSGNRVYGIGGIPIGRVDEVANTTSKIVMFSNVGEKNQVIAERTGLTLSIEGIGGGNLETQVAQDMDIMVGDLIILPQFGAAVVASVAAIDTSVASALKRVLFRVPVNVFNLRWVEIINDSDGGAGK
mgnify:FL=1